MMLQLAQSTSRNSQSQKQVQGHAPPCSMGSPIAMHVPVRLDRLGVAGSAPLSRGQSLRRQGRAAPPAGVGCGPHYLPESRLLPSRRSLLLLRRGESCLLPSRRSLLLLRGRDRRLTGLEARRRGGLSRWGRRGGVGDRGRLRVSGLTRLRRSGDRALRRSGDLDLGQSRDLQQAHVVQCAPAGDLPLVVVLRRQPKWPTAWAVSRVGLQPSAACIWVA